MAKITFSKLNLKLNKDVNTFQFDDKEIEVLKYLPIEDKYDLITIALQKSKDGNIYNELWLDMYFHLYMVILYSNITFTEKQKEDLPQLFDILKSTGFLDKFLENMEAVEYEELFQMLTTIKQDHMEFDNSIGGALNHIVDKLPTQANEFKKIMDTFDEEKYSYIMKLGEIAGGAKNPTV